MMKVILPLLAACAFLATPALAKTLKLPNEDFAIASITVPDSWKPEEIENGFESESPDSVVYLAAVAVGSKKGMDAELEDTFAFLKEHKVILNKKSQTEDKFTVNGIEATELVFQGKDEDGPTTVSIAFVPFKDKVVVLTYWVTTAKQKKHEKEVSKILNSLKAIGAEAEAPVEKSKTGAEDSITYPETDPLFSLKVPKGWASKHENGSIMLGSDANAAVLLQHVTDVKSAEAAQAGLPALAKGAAKIFSLTDAKLVVPADSTDVGEFKGYATEYKGKDKDGENVFWQLMIFAPKGNDYYLVTLVCNEKDDKKTAADRDAIVKSIKAVK